MLDYGLLYTADVW